MGFLVFLLLLTVIAGGLIIQARFQRDRLERIRDRARIHVIEGQLAMLRGLLRIEAAEYLARRRLMAMRASDPFGLPKDHEEWRPS